MIRPENKFSRLEFFKGIFDIDRPKPGAVAADDDNFVVPELINFLDRILQARREIVPRLPVNSTSGWDNAPVRGKKMNIYSRRKIRAQGRQIQKGARRSWESAAGQRNMRFFGKN
jgi:hypothetical protein